MRESLGESLGGRVGVGILEGVGVEAGSARVQVCQRLSPQAGVEPNLRGHGRNLVLANAGNSLGRDV